MTPMPMITTLSAGHLPWPAVLILFAYSAVCAYTDIRYRCISLALSLPAAAAGAIASVLCGRSISSASLALCPGAALGLLSLASGGAVGMGDAVFVLVLGLYIESTELICSLSAAWLLCAAYALTAVVFKGGRLKRSRKGIPFVAVLVPVLFTITGVNYVCI